MPIVLLEYKFNEHTVSVSGLILTFQTILYHAVDNAKEGLTINPQKFGFNWYHVETVTKIYNFFNGIFSHGN